MFQLILYLPDSVEIYGTQLFNMEATLFFALTFFILVIILHLSEINEPKKVIKSDISEHNCEFIISLIKFKVH